MMSESPVQKEGWGLKIEIKFEKKKKRNRRCYQKGEKTKAVQNSVRDKEMGGGGTGANSELSEAMSDR